MMNRIRTFLPAALACLLLAGCGSAAVQPPAAESESDDTLPTVTVDTPEEEEELPAAEPEEKPPAPVYAEQIADGTYPISVSSSSSMFRIVDAQLTVAGGEMAAVLALSGTGYEKLYLGTGDAALADTDDAYIPFAEDDEGRYTYEVPVEALEQEIHVSAFSTKKQTWYDRVLVFGAGDIPDGAISLGE